MQLGSQYPRNHFHFLSALAGGPFFFVASIRAAGQCFSWPRRGFPLPAVGSLSIFAIETLLALHGAELPSWWDVLQLS